MCGPTCLNAFEATVATLRVNSANCNGNQGGTTRGKKGRDDRRRQLSALLSMVDLPQRLVDRQRDEDEAAPSSTWLQHYPGFILGCLKDPKDDTFCITKDNGAGYVVDG